MDATTRLWDQWGQISVRRTPRKLTNQRLQPLIGAEFSPRITVWVDSLEFTAPAHLRGATYRVQLRAGDWSKACKLGRLAPSGAIQFDQAPRKSEKVSEVAL